MNLTIRALQENTGSAWLIEQSKSTPILSKPGVTLDKIKFGNTQMRRHGDDLDGLNPDLARPPATGGAALALVKDWHRLKGGTQTCAVEEKATVAGCAVFVQCDKVSL